MKQITIKKGTILQYKGDLNSKIYSVKEGLLRSYSIDAKGKEHIFMFAPEGWIIAGSLPPEIPCELYIDAIEDTIAYVSPKDIEKETANAAPLIKRLAVLQQRIIMLMSYAAIDRYNHFIATYPEVSQRIPQKMIASYLGITPEALSKVKSQSLKKGNV